MNPKRKAKKRKKFNTTPTKYRAIGWTNMYSDYSPCIHATRSLAIIARGPRCLRTVRVYVRAN